MDNLLSNIKGFVTNLNNHGEKMNITYEEFEKHMLAIQRIITLQNSIDSMLNDHNRKCGDMAQVYFPTLQSNVVELLEKATGDEKNEWICYWLYELDCGKKYRYGSVMSEKNEPIKLETIHDLWNLLAEDYKK